ncbi:period circadian protein homolog 3 [Brachyhypopomus gauderio]|uniref:period circadian protein homolog 3 n=1 Tax=Brachyhypopomus gauderio TaxID=698409 RepID=UPI0040420272
MPSGGSSPDGEENISPSRADRISHGAAPGGSGSVSTVVSGFASNSGEAEEEPEERKTRPVAEESGAERSGGDVDMTSNDYSSSGISSGAGSRLHSVSANQSSGSTTSSGSTKSEQMMQERKHTHREVVQAVQEMKKRLPSEKKSRSKASTVEALSYALNCVKQVQANSEYYKLLMCNGLEERKDAAVCTLGQLEIITSEHTLKNTDTFVVVFSLATGRVVYASDQASSILNCKRKFLETSKFVELLFHQDVNVFCSHTAQPHLPPWTVGVARAAVVFECAQVKSFFCRIRGGKDGKGEMRYNPFRMTPYLLNVQGVGGDEEPCCLAQVERITSGYEAPRIPPDKRVFTSTHSPGCIFLEVDERAVPLLGYLPQDLIGTSVLTCLHPEDRALILAMHRKILKLAGQPPFEHSPLRFRCQNGHYVTLDTSWSSFVNPWSRKVAFIIGRHKVRTGPLNEDVFAARNKADLPVMHEDVKELQSVIYKLFLQPVHTNGSSGYGSLGSNGSHEHHISVGSSSDSNGNLWEDTHREPVTLQQICAHVNKVKSRGQQAYLESRRKLPPVGKTSAEPHSLLPPADHHAEVRCLLQDSHGKRLHVPSYQQINCVDSIIRYLESCSGPALKRKSESLSISTSSSSSTSEEDQTAPVQNVASAGDAILQPGGGLHGPVSTGSSVTAAHTTAAVVGAPLTDITLSDKAMSVVSLTSQCSYSSTIVHVPQPESEVTALEDAPMGSEPADPTPAPAPGSAHTAPSSFPAAPEEVQLMGLTKEVLSAHTQKEEQDYVDRFRHRILESPYNSYLQQDNDCLALSNHRGDYGPQPLSAGDRFRSSKHKRPKPQGSWDSDGWQPVHYGPTPALDPSSCESSQPSVPPVQPLYCPVATPSGLELPPGVSAIAPPMVQVVNPFMTPVMAVLVPYAPACAGYGQDVAGIAPTAVVTPPFAQAPFISVANTFPPAGPTVTPPGLLSSTPATPPWLGGEELDATQPPALFSSSRSSSPLQLNLLQEELPKPAEQDNSTRQPRSSHQQHSKGDALSESGNHDAKSTSSVLLDLMMQEDARSGTGSHASGSGSGESGGSLGSGSGLDSNGTSTSLTGSSNSSKYFASNDSSDTSRKIRKSQEASDRCTFNEHEESSLWTMIQHTPEPVMMTYQIRPRDPVQVLQEDREKLLLLRPLQPWFSQQQREELCEVHAWIHHHTIPKEINTQGCASCNTATMEDCSEPAQSGTLPTTDAPPPQDGPAEDFSPASKT